MTLPYLEIFRARGKLAAYYRREGQRQRLRTPDGTAIDPADTAALLPAWQAAHAAFEARRESATLASEARIALPRSLSDLIGRYRASPEWAQLAPATRTDYEKALAPLDRDFGRRPVIGIRRHHVTLIRDKYAWRLERPPGAARDAPRTVRVSNARQANRVITVLSILCAHAVHTLGWIEANPAMRPRRLRTDSDGYRAWTQAEWLQFQDRAPPDWQFAAKLALLSAQRGQDLVTLTWADYDGTSLHVEQRKGRKKGKLWVECHPTLSAALEVRRKALRQGKATPLRIDAQHILLRPDGTPWPTPNAFQKAAGQAIRSAGLEGPVWHGLRGTAASWATNGGAGVPQLQALLGHRTAAMSQHYARGADQRHLASAAVAAITLPKPPRKRRAKKEPA